MATANPEGTVKYRIITHGNKEYKSSQLMNQLGFTGENTTFITPPFEFFPFTDLDEITSNSLFEPNPKLVNIIENSEQDVDVSAILVLISQKGIMSQGMSKLIKKTPRSPFYSFSEENETDWWDHVILVFVSEEDAAKDVNLPKDENRNITDKVKKKLDTKVKDAMERNAVIKEIVKKSGDRYISIFENTSEKEILGELMKKIEALKDKIPVGQLPHSKGYRDAVKSFNKSQKKHIRTANPNANKIYRSFIILGESGESELGNLLLGPRESQLFATAWHPKPQQGAKRITSGLTKVYGESEDKNLLQIVDLPHDLTKHSEIFAKLRTSEDVTFLIILNILSGSPSPDGLIIRIKENIQICELSDQNVFGNAIIIFTCHGTEPEIRRSSISQEEAKSYLEKKLTSRYEHVFLKKMLKIVKHQQYVYIDEFYQEYNREKILGLIFDRIEYYNEGLKGTKDHSTFEDTSLSEQKQVKSQEKFGSSSTDENDAIQTKEKEAKERERERERDLVNYNDSLLNGTLRHQ